MYSHRVTVEGLGFRVWDKGFRAGYRNSRVYSGTRASGLGSRAQNLGFRVWDTDRCVGKPLFCWRGTLRPVNWMMCVYVHIYIYV